MSGLKVIRAILAGQRDALVRPGLCDAQIQKRKAGAGKESRRGAWKAGPRFALTPALEWWETCPQKIAECDREIERAGPASQATPPKAGRSGGPNTPQVQNPHGLRGRPCGDKDATVPPGLADPTLRSLVGEAGTDLSRWKSEQHFTARGA